MALQEVLTRWGFEFDKGKVQAIERGTKRTEKTLNQTAHRVEKFNAGMSRALGLIKGVVGAYLGFRGFQMITGDVVNEVKEVKIWADRLGESVDNFAGLSAVARQNRLETEDLGDAMKELAVKANDAYGIAASKDARELFAQMGIKKEQIVDSNGELKNTSELLMVVADAYSKMGNKAKAAAAIDDLLSDAGMRASKLLALGREGIQSAIAQARANGEVHSPKTIKAALAYAKLKKAIIRSLIRFRNYIASKVLPIMVAVGQAFRRWWREGNHGRIVLDSLRLVLAAIAVIVGRLVVLKVYGWLKQAAAGAKIAATWFRALNLSLGKTALRIGMIVVLLLGVIAMVEDLIGFAQGNDSIIGRLLGAEAAQFMRDALLGVVAVAKELWVALKPAVQMMGGALKGALKDLWTLIKPAIPFIGKVLAGVLFLAIKAVEYLIRALKWLVEAIIVAAKATGEFLGAAWIWLGELWDSIVGGIKASINAIGGAFVALGKGIVFVWKWVGDQIASIWNWMKNLAVKVGKAIAWPFKKAAQAIAWVWDKTIGAIKRAVQAIIGAIRTAIRMKDALLGRNRIGGAMKVGADVLKDIAPKTRTDIVANAAHLLPGGMPGTKQPVVASRVEHKTATATVASGAVSVTVNAPADAVGPATVDEINRQLTQVITGAVDDLQKPPATQGG